MDKLPYLTERTPFTATRNACKLCAPLGASMAFKGVEGCVPLIHGGQGCATYIRRYLISHFREPVDIASSNFSEETTIFGGSANLTMALDNVTHTYNPGAIGVATTCLSETIGEDVNLMLKKVIGARNGKGPTLVPASTPSYRGSHVDGFQEAVRALVQTMAIGNTPVDQINVLPGMASPADIRHLKEILNAFGVNYVLLPDYSDTLDNPLWDNYKRIPDGGTKPSDIATMGGSFATVELGSVYAQNGAKMAGSDIGAVQTAAKWLETNHGVPRHNLPLPIGANQTDKLMETLSTLSGKPIPVEITKERGRLIDSYIDGHKYVFGKRAVVYGEEDFVASMAAFLDEIGVEVIMAASGGHTGVLKSQIETLCPEKGHKTEVLAGIDFEKISEYCHDHKPDLLVGNSKGYYIARALDIPIIRVGFPIHDRFGGHRILHLGYRGTQQLFDTIVNALLEKKQDDSEIGFKYL
ncbi:MAG: nitrogenase component 1 [Breznakibacter sp.]